MMPPMDRRTRRRPFAAARRWAAAAAVSIAAVSAAAHPARASNDEDEDTHYDGRTQGYTPNAESKSSSVGLTWLLVVVLGGATVGVMFMDAKRSHLD